MQSNIVGVGEGPGKAQTSICFNFRRLHRATLQEYLILTCNNIIRAFQARLSIVNIVNKIWLLNVFGVDFYWNPYSTHGDENYLFKRHIRYYWTVIRLKRPGR